MPTFGLVVHRHRNDVWGYCWDIWQISSEWIRSPGEHIGQQGETRW